MLSRPLLRAGGGRRTGDCLPETRTHHPDEVVLKRGHVHLQGQRVRLRVDGVEFGVLGFEGGDLGFRV